MSNYFNIETKEYPLYQGDLKLLYPDWDTDKPLPDNIVEFDYDEYPLEIPENNIVYQTEPMLQENGKYVVFWTFKEATEEQLANLARQKREAEILNTYRFIPKDID